MQQDKREFPFLLLAQKLERGRRVVDGNSAVGPIGETMLISGPFLDVMSGRSSPKRRTSAREKTHRTSNTTFRSSHVYRRHLSFSRRKRTQQQYAGVRHVKLRKIPCARAGAEDY